MIVDDHDGFRASARRMLEAAGFKVLGEAADGEGGIATVTALRPRLVLLDVQLPGIDGFAVADELLRTSPDTAVVLTSAQHPDDYDSQQLAEGSARSFVPKSRLTGKLLAEIAEASG